MRVAIPLAGGAVDRRGLDLDLLTELHSSRSHGRRPSSSSTSAPRVVEAHAV
jgi:hypothetical protein